MSRTGTTRREELVALIGEGLREVAPHLTRVDEGARLLGRDAVLDSVALVTLLVALEQRLGGIDLSTPFMAHADAPEEEHPFRCVGSLASFLEGEAGRP